MILEAVGSCRKEWVGNQVHHKEAVDNCLPSKGSLAHRMVEAAVGSYHPSKDSLVRYTAAKALGMDMMSFHRMAWSLEVAAEEWSRRKVYSQVEAAEEWSHRKVYSQVEAAEEWSRRIEYSQEAAAER